MSLVWALGKNTSHGREVGVNPNLLYLVITCAFAHSSDPGTPKTTIVKAEVLKQFGGRCKTSGNNKVHIR